MNDRVLHWPARSRRPDRIGLLKPTPSGVLQRRAVSDGHAMAPPIVHDVLRSPGRPLDDATRGFMESRFGHDFSGVRVHTDARAAESARAVNALAYTVGHHVAFDAGQYAPGRNAGRQLLAHELAHVRQQQSGIARLQNKISVSDGSDAHEKEAIQLASAVVSGQPLPSLSRGAATPGATIQRLESPLGEVQPSRPLLVRGSVGAAVAEAQRKLNLFHAQEIAAGRSGLPNGPLVEDGNFGPRTFDAVLFFQQQRFPEQPEEHDGMIGDHTWGQLDAAGPPSTPPPTPVLVPPTPPGTFRVCSRALQATSLANHAYIEAPPFQYAIITPTCPQSIIDNPVTGTGGQKWDNSPDPCGKAPTCVNCTPRPGVTDLAVCFRNAFNAYNNPSLYRLSGPNSNTFAGTLARTCCAGMVPKPAALGIVPGWDDPPAPRRAGTTPCPPGPVC